MSQCKECGQAVPDHEYEVFYCGRAGNYGSNSIVAFGTQKRTVRAANPFSAVCEAASYSEHSTGTQYLAVGPDVPRRFDAYVARLFTITKLDDDEQVKDFIARPLRGRYRVTEVHQ